MIYHFVSAAGFLVFAGVALLLSTDRRKVAWKKCRQSPSGHSRVHAFRESGTCGQPAL